jgi:F420-non-reducing hydrogenase small subunit
VTNKKAILEQVYLKTFSTINEDHVLPLEKFIDQAGHELTLPKFWDEVKALDDIVDVDYYVPACPPTHDMNMQILNVVKAFVEEGKPLPPKGTVIASEKTLCDDCKRKRSDDMRVEKFVRIHEKDLDPDQCFLEQGVICMGPATRAGCGAVCTDANMPCRGCMGPTAVVSEQGASMLSALASIYNISDKENELAEEQIEKIISQIIDPLGSFYRFSLPKSQLGRVVKDTQEPVKANKGE